MYKLIDTSTSQGPTGMPPQRKLFRVKSGPYAGRLVILYAKTSSEIVLRWANDAYSDWTSPQTIISDSADYPFSATIDGDGHIYLVYTRQTSLSSIYLKLTFSAGNWVAGTPSTICNIGPCFYPAIARIWSTEMWCAYAYYNSGLGVYSIRAKVSYDQGATWGSGPSDSGEQLSEPDSNMPYVCLTLVGTNLYAVYSQSRSNLYFRHLSGSGGIWDTPVHILTANYIDSNFDCACSPDKKLGIAICPSVSDRIYFREYDGVSLSGLQEAVQFKGRSPQVAYLMGKVHIFFAQSAGGDFWIPAYGYKDGDTFGGGELTKGIGSFEKVFLYSDLAVTHFADRTSESISAASADIYHPHSNAILAAAGDCLYLGRSDKFFCGAIVLSTSGNAGAVVWEYFDGGNWIGFTPQSGAYHFNFSSQLIYFWNDPDSAPVSWQACSVNSEFKYWIRARVVTPFTTPPVGSQILATSKVNHFIKTEEAA
jgi:hypothetical protein